MVTEVINIIKNWLQTGVTGEKVVTVTSTAVNKAYAVLETDASGRALSALVNTADFSSGFGTVTGTAGEKAYGTAYNYDCVAVNTWSRTPIGLNSVNLILGNVSDSTGVKSASYMATNYSTAIDYQQVNGVNGYYELRAGAWKYISQTVFPTLIATTYSSGLNAASTLTTYTSPVDGTYDLCGFMNISSVTINSIKLNVTFTDDNNVSQSLDFYNMGSTTLGQSTAGHSNLGRMLIRVKAATAISVQTILITSGGSIAYSTGVTIQQLK